MCVFIVIIIIIIIIIIFFCFFNVVCFYMFLLRFINVCFFCCVFSVCISPSEHVESMLRICTNDIMTLMIDLLPLSCGVLGEFEPEVKQNSRDVFFLFCYVCQLSFFRQKNRDHTTKTPRNRQSTAKTRTNN